jgi:hypothetical protein
MSDDANSQNFLTCRTRVVGLWQPMKVGAVGSLGEGEHAVRQSNVIVDVEVQASSEALRKADCSTLDTSEACDACALALPAEDLLHEDPSHGREHTRIACEE